MIRDKRKRSERMNKWIRKNYLSVIDMLSRRPDITSNLIRQSNINKRGIVSNDFKYLFNWIERSECKCS